MLRHYGPTQTKDVPTRPGLNLANVSMGDSVLVRGTRTLSIMLAKP